MLAVIVHGDQGVMNEARTPVSTSPKSIVGAYGNVHQSYSHYKWGPGRHE